MIQCREGSSNRSASEGESLKGMDEANEREREGEKGGGRGRETNDDRRMIKTDRDRDRSGKLSMSLNQRQKQKQKQKGPKGPHSCRVKAEANTIALQGLKGRRRT